MGSFFKQLYRYSHTRPYRHNENLWPYVKIVRAASGEIAGLFYKKQQVPIVPLTELQNCCRGEVLLTASGPSVNELCFDPLSAMPAIGVNGAYFLHQRVNFRFYVIVDMGFIDRRPDILSDIIRQPGLTLFTTVHGVARIIDKFTLSGIRCRLAVVEDAAFKIYHPKINAGALRKHYGSDRSVRFSGDGHEVAFSQDIRRGIFDAGTVVYWALQIISFLGFKQLFIAGLDMNNFHLPRFYETAQSMLPTFLPEKVASLVIPAFSHASEVMRNNHISIKNLSVNSAISSDIFEKVDAHAYFKKA
ncbi:sugar glycosyltransferase [Serratia entomophila]|uniref:sugar glycosyltransferase n=1 Tax=Serratia entomophila TaxID=42906 RepID=UPI002177BE13|nr:sugar glycosyltransferase [Serratia entomophila]CAI0770001.1 lipopolysaccharide core biosynthesis protein [Serratia entomophila]CAI1501249.1 lipopolysaccharide core biosynthesis protein [Serratia entomophila]CAI1507449.1 lipopolysaccharide core biosynthesis protein [Serratia entomophila]CAI1510845.1 lipopolysaccharide core biosynthesis protein [Serratia entomophila]CAI1616090.1 lipopolysaccharide core biosynthesis protein [Serratia entomophila]